MRKPSSVTFPQRGLFSLTPAMLLKPFPSHPSPFLTTKFYLTLPPGHLRSWPPSPIPRFSGFLRLRSGDRAVTIPASWFTCKCKCKTFLIPNHMLSPQDLTFLDSTPFGCKIVAPHATMLASSFTPHLPMSSLLPMPLTINRPLSNALIGLPWKLSKSPKLWGAWKNTC